MLLFYALLFAAILMQSSVNSFNDYYDFIRGTDTIENSPPNDDAILVFNSYNPRRVRLISICFLLAALALGVYVICTTNMMPLIIGIIGTAIVIAYSAGPQPLSYMPLGEFTSGVAMGILLPIAVYSAMTGEINWQTVYFFSPLMMGISMIMLTNNTCDIERDHGAGRKTLPILLGRSKACLLHRMLLSIWILFVAVTLIVFFRGGLFILPLGLFAGRRSILDLITAKLSPMQRGYHMIGIFKANLWINGTYSLCVLISILRSLIA